MSDSVIADHVVTFNHEFDLENTKILDYKRDFYKRIISETSHIKQQKNSRNIGSHTDLERNVFSSFKNLVGVLIF